jgi:hypothetical protein
MPLMVEINNKSEIKHFSRARCDFLFYYYSHSLRVVYESTRERVSHDKFLGFVLGCLLPSSSIDNNESDEQIVSLIYLFLSLTSEIRLASH